MFVTTFLTLLFAIVAFVLIVGIIKGVRQHRRDKGAK
jgi:hypothetical protein